MHYGLQTQGNRFDSVAALVAGAWVPSPRANGMAGLGDTVVESTQVLDGAIIQYSVDGAKALGSDATNTLANTLNATTLLRASQVGGPSIPLISDTLNISTVSNGMNDANFIVGLIANLASNCFSFDATQAKLFIQEPAPGSEILKIPGLPGSSSTPVLHQGTGGIPTWVIVGGIAAAALVLILILKR